MSITSIRQRKLFKSQNNKNFLLKLLSDGTQSEKQEIYHIKTEQSEHRESYSSSRPTLQESKISKQLTVLQNKVNKQEAMTDRCFQEMESLENHHQILKQKLGEKYQMKLKLVKQRIKKQMERNIKARNKNMELINKITDKVLKPVQQKQNLAQKTKKIDFKGSENSDTENQKIAIELLEMIKFQRTHRQIKNITLPQQINGQKSQEKVLDCSNAEETLVLEVKPSTEDRQSESILLDDSYTN